MRRLASALTLAGLALLVSCSDQSTPPTAPPVELSPLDAASITSCPTPTQIRNQITALFPAPIKLAAGQAFYLVIQVALAKRDTAFARQAMFTFIQYMLFEYNRGGLIGGMSSSTQTKVANLTSALYCVVGLPAPVIPPGALGPDGGITVVTPSNTSTTLITQTKQAGIQIPPGAANNQAVVTISRIPDAPPPLLTPLDQYPAFYQYNVSPEGAFASNVTIGVCVGTAATPTVFARLKIAHNVGTSVEILNRVTLPFTLNCDTLGLALGPTQGGLLGLALRGLGTVREMLLPASLQASTVGQCCVGGSTKTFSPFGAVDSLTIASAVSPTSFSLYAGAAVPSGQLPSVRVLTPNGNPVPGLLVTFTRSTAGEATTDTAKVTDATGTATLGSWTLSGTPGANVVVATVTPIAGTTVQGSPITFTATGITSSPFDWSATGWNWQQLSANSGTTVPNQASILSSAVNNGLTGYTGPAQAPFSTANYCGNYTTNSPGVFPLNSIVAFRRDFILPSGASSGTLYLSVDNDFKVFVNGVDQTSSAVFTGPGGGSTGLISSGLEAGFMNHDGCASSGQGDFTLSLTGLSAIVNTVVIVALDRGTASYFDASVVPPVPHP
ncbi:MAG TPA: hypothetical protein VEI47_08970 [Gemmatimonadales bacterium]|nr:hypothetical protein [Gemmatimonadales bacterium]